MAFAKMMATMPGRAVRAIAGIALILVGLLVIGGTAGIIVAVIGVAPLYAGLTNICLIAPIIGAPLSGVKALASNGK